MKSGKKRRGKAEDPNKLKDRTLYVRLPHTIKKKEDVEQLFFGKFKVKLFRQASRNCSVVFPSVEEKIKNLAAAKGKKINGKNVIVSPLVPAIEKSVKPVKKKIVMPEVKEDKKITQTLFISNIKCGTKPHEVQEAIEGCGNVVFLKAHTPHLRSAVAKINSIQTAAEYLTKVKEWPVVNGNRLILKPDTRVKHKNTRAKAKAAKASKTKSSKKSKPKIAPSIQHKPKPLKNNTNRMLKQPMKAKTKLAKTVTK